MACVSFWSVKAELGLRGPRKDGAVFLEIWYKATSHPQIEKRATRTHFSLLDHQHTVPVAVESVRLTHSLSVSGQGQFAPSKCADQHQ